MTTKDLGKTSTGMQPNVAALLSYVLGWVTGLIFFLIEKDNKFVRFHAMQSMLLFGGLQVLWLVCISIPFLWPLLSVLTVINLLAIVLWVILLIKSYQGEKFKLPLVGDIADKKS